ncbi:MAG: hypothetical protein O7G30_13465 [Proteobacteria bacterium]|nr:hypothetical protein [Pseudomonadota bacterium]
MRYKAYPPFCLPLGHLRRDRSAAVRVHLAYARIVWRSCTSGLARVRLAVRVLRWPAEAAMVCVVATALYGASVRRRTGKGIARQVIEQLDLALRCGVQPMSYYVLRLYESQNKRNAQHYIHRYETKPNGIYSLLRRPGRRSSGLGNKQEFYERCRENDLPTAPLVMQLTRGEILACDGDPGSLPRRDLFVKPKRGKGGEGTARWDWVGDDLYREPGGEVVSEAALLEHLKALSRERSILVQHRLVNHTEIRDLSNGALTTARILTCLDERGEPEIVAAVFRMAVGKNRVVDNIHAGGIASAVDLGTGKLGRATSLDPRRDWIDVHPETGAAIAGRTLPHWNEALDLVRRAHREFNRLVVVGWDVGITEDGPVLVEGNGSPCVTLMQRPHDSPLGLTRLGELLAHHLETLEAESFPARTAGRSR